MCSSGTTPIRSMMYTRNGLTKTWRQEKKQWIKERAGARISKETAEAGAIWRSNCDTDALPDGRYYGRAVCDKRVLRGNQKGCVRLHLNRDTILYVDGGWADSTPFENVSKSRRMNAPRSRRRHSTRVLISTRKRARFTSYSTTEAMDLC